MASRNQLLIVNRGGHSTSATITLNGLARGVLQRFDGFSFDTQPNRDDLFGGSRSARDDVLHNADVIMVTFFAALVKFVGESVLSSGLEMTKLVVMICFVFRAL